jgi:hypothetical protein
VAALNKAGLVFRAELDCPEPAPVVFVPREFLQLMELPPHVDGFLGKLLQESPPEVLADIAERLFPSQKVLEQGNALALRLRRILLDPVELMSHINSLNDVEHEIFRVLSDRRGFALYRDLLENVTSRKVDHSRAEVLNGLLYGSGLAFVASEGHNKHMNLAAIPRDVFWMLTNGFRTDDRPMQEIDLLTGLTIATDQMTLQQNTGRLLRDLAVLASKVDIHRVRKLAAGGINRIELRRIHEIVAPAKPIAYVELLSHFLIQCKHLFEVDGRWRAADGLQTWFQDSPRAWRELYGWWLRTTAWAEDLLERAQSGPEAQAADAVAILRLRSIILEAVASAGRENWVHISAFFESLAPQVENHFPQHPWGPGGRRLIMREVFENVVGESLHWLGLVTIGSPQVTPNADSSNGTQPKTKSRTTRRKAAPAIVANGEQSPLYQPGSDWVFRQTDLGKLLFPTGALIDPDVAQEDHLDIPELQFRAEWMIVQPNLEIIAPPDLALNHLYEISRWCKIRNVDVMTTLEMTKDSVRLALDAGLRTGDLMALLQKCSRMPVPETVKALIDECATRHGEVKVHGASGYITLDDRHLIEAMRQNQRLSSMVKEVFADEVAILAEGVDLGRMVRELRNLGFMPRLESSAVHATGDDRYHLSLEPDDFYHVLAAVRLLPVLNELLGVDISEGRIQSLLSRLLPTGESLFQHETRLDTVTKSYGRRLREVFAKHIDDVEGRYKSQVSRLVSKSIAARGPSRHNYRGKSPAEAFDDIYKLLEYAVEHELDVEVQYVRQNNQETQLVIQPKYFQGDKISARCPANDTEGIYAIRRILNARLV